MINVDELEELLAKATGTQYGPDDRARPLPWTVWTSNSHRRIGCDATHADGDVLHGIVHRDGCTDLSMPEDRLIALVDALNQYPAVLSLLRHQQEEMGWRPIESAPKDGTVIILFNSDEQEVDAGYWCRWVEQQDQGFFEMTGGNHWMLGDCTHWMPLPKPPSSLPGEG